jgi:hypothetical protein
MTRRRKKRSSDPARRGRGASDASPMRHGGRRSGAVHPEQQRTIIAQQAARIVVEQGIADYGLAKRKAAERIGVSSASLLPTNAQIELAVVEHQRLFGGMAHSHRLRELRRGACEAMRFFETFSPRLVGPVLSGAVTEHSVVTLHLYADAPEAVARQLVQHAIPYREGDRRLRYAAERIVTHPVFSFSAEGVDYELVVMPTDSIRQPPISPVDGGAVRRASLRQVEALCAAAEEELPGGD